MSSIKDWLMRMEEEAITLPFHEWIHKYPGQEDIYKRIEKELKEYPNDNQTHTC